MEIHTTIHFSESDIRDILRKHLGTIGFEPIDEMQIAVRSKSEVPEGATPGDCIGIEAKVKKVPVRSYN